MLIWFLITVSSSSTAGPENYTILCTGTIILFRLIPSDGASEVWPIYFNAIISAACVDSSTVDSILVFLV